MWYVQVLKNKHVGQQPLSIIASKSVRPVLAHNLVFLVSSVKQKKKFLLYAPLNTHQGLTYKE